MERSCREILDNKKDARAKGGHNYGWWRDQKKHRSVGN